MIVSHISSCQEQDTPDSSWQGIERASAAGGHHIKYTVVVKWLGDPSSSDDNAAPPTADDVHEAISQPYETWSTRFEIVAVALHTSNYNVFHTKSKDVVELKMPKAGVGRRTRWDSWPLRSSASRTRFRSSFCTSRPSFAATTNHSTAVA